MNQPYEKEEYFSIALDPIHVGTGGYRLGRVDLSIVRDPATGIPKIPATSLTGPARAYTAMLKDKYPMCAGKGGERGENHCGNYNPACPVCIPYGFSKPDYSFQGLAQFFDAHIVLFPVATMIGPVWVTSPMALEFLGGKFEVRDDEFCALGDIDNQRLNFGWLMLNRDKNGRGVLDGLTKIIPEYIKHRAVMVSDKFFPKIVNTNLEVRTSVSIDPATGAAEEKALFTYEAIPRGTVLKFDVIYNDPQNFRINGNHIKIKKADSSDDIVATPQWVQKQVECGLRLFEVFGVGGMNTRGMGRMKILDLSKEEENGSE